MRHASTDRLHLHAEALFRDERNRQPIRVVCVSAHPDDAETGCGGTLARLADAGHHVTILYLTRGEAGTKHLPVDAPCRRTSNQRESVAAIRVAEAEKASHLLGAQPLFWDQPDGDTSVNADEYRRFNALQSAEKPDIVFAHWPIDSHHDHRNASLLAYHAWQSAGGDSYWSTTR
jgi:LmbE family N-acetylglucosaminyl deacetylase